MITKKEIIQVLAMLKANYSSAFKDMTKQDAEAKINLWTSMFADVEPEEMLLAVQKMIATKPYFQSPIFQRLQRCAVRLQKSEQNGFRTLVQLGEK